VHEQVQSLSRVLSASDGPRGSRAGEATDDRSTGEGTDDRSTGDAAVDAALTRLGELDAMAVREHVGVFDAVHRALQDRLADTEE